MNTDSDLFAWKAGFWTAVVVAVVMIAIILITANGYGVALEEQHRLEADLDALLIEKQACGDGWYEQLELTATLMSMIEERENHQPYYPEGNWRNYIDGLREELKTCRGSLEYVLSGDLRGAPCRSSDDGIECGWNLCPQPRYDFVIQNLCDADGDCSSCVIMTEGDYDFCFYHAYKGD